MSERVDFSACMIPMLEALEWKGDQAHFIEALPYPRERLDLNGVLNAMSNLRYESDIVELETSQMQSYHFPCFFISKSNKAYVLLNNNHDNFLVFDNESSEYQELDDFDEVGTCVIFKPMSTTEGSLLGRQTNWFVKVLARFKKALWASFLISLFMSLLAIASPILIIFLYGHIQSSGSDLSVGMVSAGVLIYLLIDVSFRFFRNHLFNYIGARLSYIVGGQVIRRILYLHPAKTSAPSVSSQTSRIKEFEGIHEFLSGMALPTLFDTFLIVVLILGLAILGGELAYVPMGGIAIFFVFGLIVRSVQKKLSVQSSQSTGNRNELLFEMVTEMRSFRTSGMTDKWFARFKERSIDSSMNNYASAKISALVNAFSNFLIQGSGLVTVSFGVTKVLEGELSMGALMGVMLITFRILTPLKGFFNTVGQFERFSRSIKQIDQFMNMELEIKEEEASSGTRLNGDIRYSNIYLKYSSEHLPALQNVSLTIGRGQCMTFCGPGGSGRSSLFKTLMDLAIPQSGQVYVDGINVKQLSPVQMRMSFSYVPREVQIFEASLRDNIMMASPSAAEEELDHLLEHFSMMDAIDELEEGLDTIIHPEKNSLTDNFVRKVGIVRALLKNTNILLMDKPEQCMLLKDMELLKELIREKKGVTTILMISNNKEVMSWSDRVVLMDKGRVVKDGEPMEVADYFYNKT